MQETETALFITDVSLPGMGQVMNEADQCHGTAYPHCLNGKKIASNQCNDVVCTTQNVLLQCFFTMSYVPLQNKNKNKTEAVTSAF